MVSIFLQTLLEFPAVSVVISVGFQDMKISNDLKTMQNMESAPNFD